MRAKTINNFERGKDPKKTMDLGMTPERWIEKATKELEKVGILLEPKPAHNHPNVIEFYFWDIGPRVFTDKHGIVNNYEGSYVSKEDGNDWGWDIIGKNNGNTILNPTPDMEEFIRKLIEIKFGSVDSIQRKLDSYQPEIDLLNTAMKKLTVS